MRFVCVKASPRPPSALLVALYTPDCLLVGGVHRLVTRLFLYSLFTGVLFLLNFVHVGL